MAFGRDGVGGEKKRERDTSSRALTTWANFNCFSQLFLIFLLHISDLNHMLFNYCVGFVLNLAVNLGSHWLSILLNLSSNDVQIRAQVFVSMELARKSVRFYFASLLWSGRVIHSLFQCISLRFPCFHTFREMIDLYSLLITCTILRRLDQKWVIRRFSGWYFDAGKSPPFLHSLSPTELGHSPPRSLASLFEIV